MTVADRPFPVENIEELDISRYGVVATDGEGRSTVIVPAEFPSTESLKKMLKRLKIDSFTAFRAVMITKRSSGG